MVVLDLGLVLRCDVVLRLSRQLLDEAPEVLGVRAFDHLFEWGLSPVGEQDPEEIIRWSILIGWIHVMIMCLV